MKISLLFIAGFLFSQVLNAQVEAISPVYAFEIISYKKKIKEYIEPRINAWQQKGKFEKTEEYRLRVTEQTRLRKIEELQAEIIAELASRQQIRILGDEYDADNEVFKIYLDNRPPIYLPVPLREAKDFDAHFHTLQVENAQLVLTDADEFVLQSADFLLPALRKKYTYNARDVVTFNIAELHLKFEEVALELPSARLTPRAIEQKVGIGMGKSDVDTQLPKTGMWNPDAIAVVIGNAVYTRTKPVNYAVADAQAMKKYLMEVLGFQEGNIFYRENAFKSDFEEIFGIAGNERGRLYNAVKPGISDVFVFYAGHGAPGLDDKRGYFVPINSDPLTVNLTGYPIDLLYQNLSKISARNVTVVLDACFSGADLLEGISPVIVQSKGVRDIRNGVLLASSTSDQVSAWYPEKYHGLFTYFFLKGIHSKAADLNNDGKITFQEMHQYVSDRSNGVPYHARRLRNVDQIPSLDGEGFDRVLVQF